MKYIEKIKLINFRRFRDFEYTARPKRNIFLGDNESGKSTILQAIDITLGGSRSRVENLGLETLFNRDAVLDFLGSKKEQINLPKMIVEIYLNDHREIFLEGKNNSDDRVCHGLRLTCEPMIDDYGAEIDEVLKHDDAIFPFEYYNIQFWTFAGYLFTQNRRFINHILIDSSLIGTEHATRQYTKSLYEVNTSLTDRHRNNHSYRQSKAAFTGNNLKKLNDSLAGAKFDLKSDGKSNLELDLMITQEGIPVSQMGKGKQSFIKTEFALQRGKDSRCIDMILIEEPENHLSHLNMKKLINQIECAADTQVIIATHSNSVCSRLDLHNASLIGASSTSPVALSKLPDDTADYFIKAPNNKILEFVLSKNVLLVEGDAEYILIEGMYLKCFGEPLEELNIHVIAVGGTSFKRYLDLALLLNTKAAVIRDNDGNYQSNCVDNYADYAAAKNIQIFSDQDGANRTTLEKCLYKDNQALCDKIFSKGRRSLTPEEYMLANKADAALKLLKEGADELVVPGYIVQAFEWIRK